MYKISFGPLELSQFWMPSTRLKHFEMASPLRIAVVGAGLTGLTCSRQLQTKLSQEVSVTIFEKSRSVSGRCATKTNFLDTLIDHGAPYFTLSNPETEQLLRPLLPDLRTLPPDAVIDESGVPIPHKHPLHYCASGNSGVGTALSSGLNVLRHTPVISVGCDGTVLTNPKSLKNTADVKSYPRFDLVVVTAPLPQAAILLSAPSAVSEDWSSSFAPTLTALLAYDMSKIPPTSPIHQSAAGKSPFAISADDMWVGCETYKRKNDNGLVILVAQASEAFSDEFVDRAEDEWLPKVMGRAEELWGVSERARVSSFAKRWRYARVRNGRARQPQRWEWMGPKLVVSGDGAIGISSVEEAVLEGLHIANMAEEILNKDKG